MLPAQMGTRLQRGIAAVALAGLLAACTTPNEIANRIGQAPENAAQLRETETRRYEIMEPELLAEATSVLQDLGFHLAESAPGGGVLVASKSRDAHEAAQVAGQVALALVAAAFLVVYIPNWDQAQSIQVTVVTSPEPASRQTALRISFERVVFMSQGGRRYERLDDPKLYEEFFGKLSTGIAIGARRT
jgi:hypothetical protein